MTKITFRLPNDQPELSAALTQFIAAEFNQQAEFVAASASTNEQTKDAALIELAWQAAEIIATLEGAIQFAERVQRMERVKTLLNLIKAKGKAVYLKIGDKKEVDISSKSVDQTMDLLANDKDKTDDNK